MRKLFAVLAAVCLVNVWFAAPTKADINPLCYVVITPGMGTNVVGITYAANGSCSPGATYCTSGCTGTTAAGRNPTIFLGEKCLCTAAQTGNLTVWDNTIGSGQVVELTGPLSSGQKEPEAFGYGVNLVLGLTVQMSAAATGTGIMVYFK